MNLGGICRHASSRKFFRPDGKTLRIKPLASSNIVSSLAEDFLFLIQVFESFTFGIAYTAHDFYYFPFIAYTRDQGWAHIWDNLWDKSWDKKFEMPKIK